MVSSSSRLSRRAPDSHSSITFFQWLEANRAEREPGQARAFWARRASGRNEVERLDAAPALGTLSSEKMGSPPPAAGFRAAVFSIACCNLAASWCPASLI